MILNRCFSFEPSIHQRILKTKMLCSTTVFNIDNNQKWLLSSKSAYIMISEDHVTQ